MIKLKKRSDGGQTWIDESEIVAVEKTHPNGGRVFDIWLTFRGGGPSMQLTRIDAVRFLPAWENYLAEVGETVEIGGGSDAD